MNMFEAQVAIAVPTRSTHSSAHFLAALYAVLISRAQEVFLVLTRSPNVLFEARVRQGVRDVSGLEMS